MPSMAPDTTPHYALKGEILEYHAARMLNPSPGGTMRAQAGLPSPTARRELRVPIRLEGPLALVLDRNHGVVLRHGARAEVEAWVGEIWWQRADYVSDVTMLHFPASPLGIETINAMLRTAFATGRLLLGAGPGERPHAIF